MATQTVKFPITDINVTLNSNDMVAIITAPGEQNESGVFQMKEGQLENIAQKSGIPSLRMLRNAFFEGFNNLEDSFLEADATYVEEGETILRNGEAVIGEDGEPMTYTKSHWTFENYQIVLSESSAEYVSDLKKQVDQALLMEDAKIERDLATKRALKRKRRKLAQGVNTEDSSDETDTDSDDDVEI